MPALLAAREALLMPSRYTSSRLRRAGGHGRGVPVWPRGWAGCPSSLVRTLLRARGSCRLTERLSALWGDPAARSAEGDALIARARENHSEERYVAALLDLYARVSRPDARASQ